MPRSSDSMVTYSPLDSITMALAIPYKCAVAKNYLPPGSTTCSAFNQNWICFLEPRAVVPQKHLAARLGLSLNNKLRPHLTPLPHNSLRHRSNLHHRSSLPNSSHRLPDKSQHSRHNKPPFNHRPPVWPGGELAVQTRPGDNSSTHGNSKTKRQGRLKMLKSRRYLIEAHHKMTGCQMRTLGRPANNHRITSPQHPRSQCRRLSNLYPRRTSRPHRNQRSQRARILSQKIGRAACRARGEIAVVFVFVGQGG